MAQDIAPLMDVARLAEELAAFSRDRDWDQFHSPKNLSMALAGETGELLELFQWMSEEQSQRAGVDAATAQSVRDELADIQIYLVRLADKLGVDLNAAVTDKLKANAAKYPVQSARGSSRKYTTFKPPE